MSTSSGIIKVLMFLFLFLPLKLGAGAPAYTSDISSDLPRASISVSTSIRIPHAGR